MLKYRGQQKIKMKSNQVKNKGFIRRHWYLVAVLLVVIAAGTLYLLMHGGTAKPTASNTNTGSSGIKPPNTIDYSPARSSDNASTDKSKGSTPAAYSPPAGSSSGAAPSMSITITEAKKVGGGNIEVSAIVQGATSGTCTFDFSTSDGGPAQQTYTEPVQLATNYYTCPPHTVSGLAGNSWYVSATLESSGQTAGAKWANNPV